MGILYVLAELVSRDTHVWPNLGKQDAPASLCLPYLAPLQIV